MLVLKEFLWKILPVDVLINWMSDDHRSTFENMHEHVSHTTFSLISFVMIHLSGIKGRTKWGWRCTKITTIFSNTLGKRATCRKARGILFYMISFSANVELSWHHDLEICSSSELLQRMNRLYHDLMTYTFQKSFRTICRFYTNITFSNYIHYLPCEEKI